MVTAKVIQPTITANVISPVIGAKVKPYSVTRAILHGIFTPENDAQHYTISELTDAQFTHFLCKLEGHMTVGSTPLGKRMFCACWFDFTPNAMNGFSVSTDVDGMTVSEVKAFPDPTLADPVGSPPASMVEAGYLKTKATAKGGGYLVAEKTYEWWAW